MTTQTAARDGQARQGGAGWEVFYQGTWYPLEAVRAGVSWADAVSVDPTRGEVVFHDSESGAWVYIDGTEAQTGGQAAGAGGDVDRYGPAPDWWPQAAPWPPLTQPKTATTIYGDVIETAPAQFDTSTYLSVARQYQPEPQPELQSEQDPIVAQIDAERRLVEAQQANRVNITSLQQVAALAAYGGDLDKAQSALDLADRPSAFQFLQTALQYADNPEALRILFAFGKSQGYDIPELGLTRDTTAATVQRPPTPSPTGAGVPSSIDPTLPVQEQAYMKALQQQGNPFFEQQQVVPVPQPQGQGGEQDLVWDSERQEWVRVNQSPLANLISQNPLLGLAALKKFDPSAFTELPPVGGISGMPSPEDAFLAAVGGEQGLIPLPVIPGQKGPQQPVGKTKGGLPFPTATGTVPPPGGYTTADILQGLKESAASLQAANQKYAASPSFASQPAASALTPTAAQGGTIGGSIQTPDPFETFQKALGVFVKRAPKPTSRPYLVA